MRMLAVAYEKTQELARELRAVGCGDLDVEGNNSSYANPLVVRIPFIILNTFWNKI